MTDKVRLGMLSTGVPGLDILLGGGLTEFSFTLIAGAPGSGKTTLAHQIMFALANPQRRALFFTVLGEPPLKMLRYQQQFPFFDMDKVGPVIRYVNLADDLRDLRQTVFRTLSALAKRGVTVLVTAGMDDSRPSLRTSPHELAFLADAVVAMRFAEVGGALRKFLMVVKVRGVDHSSELREYHITGSGIEVDERPVPYEGVLTGWPRS